MFSRQKHITSVNLLQTSYAQLFAQGLQLYDHRPARLIAPERLHRSDKSYHLLRREGRTSPLSQQMPFQLVAKLHFSPTRRTKPMNYQHHSPSRPVLAKCGTSPPQLGVKKSISLDSSPSRPVLAKGSTYPPQLGVKKSVSFDNSSDIVHFIPKVNRRDQDKVWSRDLKPQAPDEEPRGLERHSVTGISKYFGNYRKAVETVLLQQDRSRRFPCSEQSSDELIARAYRQQTASTRLAAARIAEKDEAVAKLCYHDGLCSSPYRRRGGKRSNHKGIRCLLRNFNQRVKISGY